MTLEEIEKRVKDLESKGLTVWGKLPDTAKFGAVIGVIIAVVYLLANLHL